jgi:hypothetical protein
VRTKLQAITIARAAALHVTRLIMMGRCPLLPLDRPFETIQRTNPTAHSLKNVRTAAFTTPVFDEYSFSVLIEQKHTTIGQLWHLQGCTGGVSLRWDFQHCDSQIETEESSPHQPLIAKMRVSSTSDTLDTQTLITSLSDETTSVLVFSDW